MVLHHFPHNSYWERLAATQGLHQNPSAAETQLIAGGLVWLAAAGLCCMVRIRNCTPSRGCALLYLFLQQKTLKLHHGQCKSLAYPETAAQQSPLVIWLMVLSNCNSLGKNFSMPDVCLRLKFSGKFQPNYFDHFQEEGESTVFCPDFENK